MQTRFTVVRTDRNSAYTHRYVVALHDPTITDAELVKAVDGGHNFGYNVERKPGLKNSNHLYAQVSIYVD